MSPRDSTHKTAKPVEAVAIALCNHDADAIDQPWAPYWDDSGPVEREEYRDMARVALTRLRELGMINIEGIQAIKAEEAGKGK